MSQDVMIWGPNCPFPDGHTFHVHAEGCADLTRGTYRRLKPNSDQGGYHESHTSQQSVVESMYADQIAESGSTWTEGYEQDFRFFPCVTLPREETAAVRCSYEEDVSMNREFAVETYSCRDEATVLVWLPPSEYAPDGETLATCEYHGPDGPRWEPTEHEAIPLADVPFRCSACSEPVWLRHPEGHAYVAAENCPDCRGLADARGAAGLAIETTTEHPACSCPEWMAQLAAMNVEPDYPAATL